MDGIEASLGRPSDVAPAVAGVSRVFSSTGLLGVAACAVVVVDPSTGTFPEVDAIDKKKRR